MDIDKVLLTEKESLVICSDCHIAKVFCPNCEFQAKANALKLLKVLEDEGHIAHERYEVHDDGLTVRCYMKCIPDCWLCKLKKDLGGE